MAVSLLIGKLYQKMWSTSLHFLTINSLIQISAFNHKSGNRRAALADYRALVRLGSPLAADLKEALDRAAKN